MQRFATRRRSPAPKAADPSSSVIACWTMHVGRCMFALELPHRPPADFREPSGIGARAPTPEARMRAGGPQDACFTKTGTPEDAAAAEPLPSVCPARGIQAVRASWTSLDFLPEEIQSVEDVLERLDFP